MLHKYLENIYIDKVTEHYGIHLFIELPKWIIPVFFGFFLFVIQNQFRVFFQFRIGQVL